jgi:hypothetical protein
MADIERLIATDPELVALMRWAADQVFGPAMSPAAFEQWLARFNSK